MDCKIDNIIMERSLNEQWSVDDNLEMDTFLDDGGASEFSNYYCDNCETPLDTKVDVDQHLKGSV